MPVTMIGNIRGPAGATGATGPAGFGFLIRGAVDDEDGLDGIISPAPGEAYQTLDTGHVWQWDGTQWTDAGPFRGPPGATGPEGPEGPAGTGFDMQGSVAHADDLPPSALHPDPPHVGDAWWREAPPPPALVTWDGDDWVTIGDIRGPEGPPGATGATGADGADGARGSLWWIGDEDPTDPFTDMFPEALSGDLYLNTTTGDIFQYIDNTLRRVSAGPTTPAAPMRPRARPGVAGGRRP